MMSWHPHATVAVIVEKEGKFLLVEESSSGKIVFNQPAGHIEEDETFIEAACRETLEESAWYVTPKYLVGFYIYKSGNNNTTYHRACFYAEALSHDPTLELDDGIIRAVWMTRDEIESNLEKLRSPMVLKCIDDYLAGKEYPLELIHEYSN
ncbi:NUDIX hydrolase [Neptuniibacter sp. UBA847]|uniref:NUDIX hydrolase n=2 Tax=unclassified Neptuniibacter TaxID=2630693 RepID=UPI0025CCE4B0|nr:NUDIX hydrolase [Neptuniibacter sp. UBA847]|tara:strand:- start:495 stop:947 length:453 start_codon:yes stop_codon:yes gene_type:complete